MKGRSEHWIIVYVANTPYVKCVWQSVFIIWKASNNNNHKKYRDGADSWGVALLIIYVACTATLSNMYGCLAFNTSTCLFWMALYSYTYTTCLGPSQILYPFEVVSVSCGPLFIFLHHSQNISILNWFPLLWISYQRFILRVFH